MFKTITLFLIATIASADIESPCAQLYSEIHPGNKEPCVALFQTSKGKFFKIAKESGDVIAIVSESKFSEHAADSVLEMKNGKNYFDGKHHLNLYFHLQQADGYYLLKNDDTKNNFFRLIKRFIAVAELVKAANSQGLHITELNPLNIVVKDDTSALFVDLDAAKPLKTDKAEDKTLELDQLKALYSYLFDDLKNRFIEMQLIRIDGISIYKFMQFQDNLNSLTVGRFSMDAMLKSLNKTFREANRIFNYTAKYLKPHTPKPEKREQKENLKTLLTQANQESIPKLTTTKTPQVLKEEKEPITNGQAQISSDEQISAGNSNTQFDTSSPSSETNPQPVYIRHNFNPSVVTYRSGSINPIYFLLVLVVFVVAGFIIHAVITNPFRNRI